MAEEKDKNKGKIVDKIIMGAVIGGAIGSVLGASIAPKKGKESRDDLMKAAKMAQKKTGTFFSTIKNFIKRKEKKEEYKSIPHE